MIYSVWRVAAAAYFLLGTTGVLMKVFSQAYAGGTKGFATAVVLMAASSLWLYRNEMRPKVVAVRASGH